MTSMNTKGSTPLPTHIVSTMTSNKGIKLILIPGHEEECKKVWETHVLLLASLNSKNICFGGPYRPELDYEAISGWFTTYEDENPITTRKPLGVTS